MKKQLKNVGLFIGLMIIVSGNVFIQELLNLDEMWVYNFARCILNGLLPYKDFSIIITPLFPMISSIFLKIFGDEMVVLRVAEVFEITAILFISYKILNKVKVNKGVAVITILRNILYVFKCILL